MEKKDEPGFAEDTNELLRCAKINFENVEKMNSQIKAHPIYALAKRQLDECVRRLDEEEDKQL